jgi:hypothetical protein
MANTIAEAAHVREVSDPVWRILTGTAAFGLGVFICGSVGSYDPLDPSWNAATNRSVENLFGAGGAVFADAMRQLLGWSAWVAGFALMIGGAMRAVLIGAPSVRRWCLGFLFVPLSAACFAAWPVPTSLADASWPGRHDWRWLARSCSHAIQGAALADARSSVRYRCRRPGSALRLCRARLSAR